MPWKEGKERVTLRKPSRQDAIIILTTVGIALIVIIVAILLL